MAEQVLYHHRTRGRSVEGVHIRSIAAALRELGFRVDILSLPGADPEAPDVPASSKPQGLVSRLLSTLASRAPEWLFEISELLYNLLAWWRLRARLRRDNPVWIYERYSLFLFAGVWLAARRGVPIVLEVNDSAVMPRVRPLLMRALAERIEKWVFSHCDGLVLFPVPFVIRCWPPMAASAAPSSAPMLRTFPALIRPEQIAMPPAVVSALMTSWYVVISVPLLNGMAFIALLMKPHRSWQRVQILPCYWSATAKRGRRWKPPCSAMALPIMLC